MAADAVRLKSNAPSVRERVNAAELGALAGGTALIVPKPEVCEARAAKFGRIGVYDSGSRDWIASMALVEKLYPDYKA